MTSHKLISLIKLLKKNLSWVIIMICGIYFVAYFALCGSGEYKDEVFGIRAGSVLAPKGFPRKWHPFQLYTINGEMTLSHIVFYPAIQVDRLVFHPDR